MPCYVERLQHWFIDAQRNHFFSIEANQISARVIVVRSFKSVIPREPGCISAATTFRNAQSTDEPRLKYTTLFVLSLGMGMGNYRMRTGRPNEEVCACVRVSHIHTISIFSPFHSIWFMSSTRNMYSMLGGLEVLLQQRSYVGRALKWDGIKCGGGQFRPTRFSVIKSCRVCLYLKHARIQK